MPNVQEQLRVLTEQNKILSGLADALKARERLHLQADRIDRKIESLVAASREVGVTWARIGQILGVSKQAAWERFGKTDPDPIRSLPPSTEEGG